VADSTLLQILRGYSDANIRFHDLRALLLRLGFTERIKGSHPIFTHDSVEEILNLAAEEFSRKTLSGQTSRESDRTV